MGDQASAAAKLRMALELSEFAEQVQRQNLRRRYPEESDQQIEVRLGRWLTKREEPFELPRDFRVRS